MDADERRWAALAHLSGLLWLTGFPFAGSIASSIVYVTKRHLSPLVATQMREAQNFQNTVSIGVAAIVVASCVLFGSGIVAMLQTGQMGLSVDQATHELAVIAIMAAALAGLMVVNVVLSVLAAVAAGRGHAFRYPVCLRLLH